MPGVTKPTTSNTGCQTPQSSLTANNATVTITTDDTVVENQWFKAGLIIKANRVIARNCLINENSSTDSATGNKIGVQCYSSSYVGTLLDRCTITPANPDVLCYGLIGSNVTTHRCLTTGGWTDLYNWQTDTSTTSQRPGSCYSVGDCLWLPTVYPNDPHQNNGESHSDCIQIANGGTHVVYGSTLHAIVGDGSNNDTGGYSHSHGMVIGPYAVGAIRGVRVESSFFSGGGAQLSAFPNAATDRAPIIPKMKIVNNQFDATGCLNQLKGGTYNPQSILITPATYVAAMAGGWIHGNTQVAPCIPQVSGGTPYGPNSATTPVPAFVQVTANG